MLLKPSWWCCVSQMLPCTCRCAEIWFMCKLFHKMASLWPEATLVQFNPTQLCRDIQRNIKQCLWVLESLFLHQRLKAWTVMWLSSLFSRVVLLLLFFYLLSLLISSSVPAGWWHNHWQLIDINLHVRVCEMKKETMCDWIIKSSTP